MVTYHGQSVRSEGEEEVRNIEEATSTRELEVKDEPVLIVILVLDGKPDQVQTHGDDEGKVGETQGTHGPLLRTSSSVKEAKSAE